MIPRKLIEAFRVGKDPVPLGWLTDEFLNRPDAFRLTYRNGSLEHPFYVPDEDSISIVEGQRAIKRHLGLMKTHWPNIHTYWRKFWDKLYIRQTISEVDWPYLRTLAQSTIQRCIPKADKQNRIIVPDPDDDRAIFRAETKSSRGWAERIVSLENERRERSASLSSTPLAQKTVTYPQTKGGKQVKARSEGETGSRCFVCRGNGHQSKICSSHKQIDNTDVNVKKNASGDWVLYNNEPFCWSFNSARGCSRTPCANGKHICTGCLSTSHCAQTCKQGKNP